MTCNTGFEILCDVIEQIAMERREGYFGFVYNGRSEYSILIDALEKCGFKWISGRYPHEIYTPPLSGYETGTLAINGKSKRFGYDRHPSPYQFTYVSNFIDQDDTFDTASDDEFKSMIFGL